MRYRINFMVTPKALSLLLGPDEGKDIQCFDNWWIMQPMEYTTCFFYKQHFFSTQTQYCLTFSWIEFQMLLRCCLIDTVTTILRHILYLVYLCPSLDRCLFMLYLCDLFFIFCLIFIVINYVTSFLYIFKNIS